MESLAARDLPYDNALKKKQEVESLAAIDLPNSRRRCAHEEECIRSGKLLCRHNLFTILDFITPNEL